MVGHSRLGKTALLAGALDERFYCAFSNNSGCGGAALARESTGQRIGTIKSTYWFCENYKKYVDKEYEMPFDQHFVIAANAPHRVYVASAEEDAWSCPKNEYLACVAADAFYKKTCGVGFVHPDRLPKAGDLFHDGMIGYYMRRGDHYLSREDWLSYIKYLETQWAKK